MKIEDLNEFIKHYVEKNKTKSAIMLTAPWGTGKSYYIQNNLLPFLEKSEIQCIVVSLYGQDDIYEISKSIFMEAKFKSLSKRYASRVIAKTIIKGVTSFCGIDLSISKKDLQKLYGLANFSGKLLIFEDLERSSIDILSILGYINNLVEQDDAKVLLVSNESEILKRGSIIQGMGNKEKTASNLTKFSEEYLKAKEKTISDTINFYPQTHKVIDDILLSFENPTVCSFLKDKDCDGYSKISHEINDIMCSNFINSNNFRALIFGCQKTIDLFEAISSNYDELFFKDVLLGNISFSLRKKKDDTLIWKSENEFSGELGVFKHPLYRFGYDYICNQYIDKEKIEKLFNIRENNYRLRSINNKLLENLDIIYNFYIMTEKKLSKLLLLLMKILN